MATQFLWLLRLIDRRFGGTCCLYHQDVRITGCPRCRLLNIYRRFGGACCFCLEGLCAAGFLLRLVVTDVSAEHIVSLFIMDEVRPGRDY